MEKNLVPQKLGLDLSLVLLQCLPDLQETLAQAQQFQLFEEFPMNKTETY